MREFNTHPTVICLTPIKNEAWILERFLKCASLWADHIIVADQGSNDNSREIASGFQKVILIENSSSTYSEVHRQKLLIDAARQIPGPRLLIALDADEMLTANFNDSPEWQSVLEAPKGTVIRFEWANLMPGISSYWSPGYNLPLGFMDDGTEHVGEKIHSARIPLPASAPTLALQRIKVLHYQYTIWERMESKHRWYQCWERLNNCERTPVNIYRQYHHVHAIPSAQIQSLPDEWLRGYEKQGIDMTATYKEEMFWWDIEVLEWLDKYGPSKFRREAIWDIDWQSLSQKKSLQKKSDNYRDPRNKFERLIQSRWLPKTQKYKDKYLVSLIDGVLDLIWR